MKNQSVFSCEPKNVVVADDSWSLLRGQLCLKVQNEPQNGDRYRLRWSPFEGSCRRRLMLLYTVREMKIDLSFTANFAKMYFI